MLTEKTFRRLVENYRKTSVYTIYRIERKRATIFVVETLPQKIDKLACHVILQDQLITLSITNAFPPVDELRGLIGTRIEEWYVDKSLPENIFVVLNDSDPDRLTVVFLSTYRHDTSRSFAEHESGFAEVFNAFQTTYDALISDLINLAELSDTNRDDMPQA